MQCSWICSREGMLAGSGARESQEKALSRVASDPEDGTAKKRARWMSQAGVCDGSQGTAGTVGEPPEDSGGMAHYSDYCHFGHLGVSLWTFGGSQHLDLNIVPISTFCPLTAPPFPRPLSSLWSPGCVGCRLTWLLGPGLLLFTLGCYLAQPLSPLFSTIAYPSSTMPESDKETVNTAVPPRRFLRALDWSCVDR